MLYIGKYVTDQIRSKRFLPPNPACSRRMERITGLLQEAGAPVKIVSQGNNLNMRFSSSLFHGTHKQIVEGTKIVYLPTIAVPYVVGLWNLFVFPFLLLAMSIAEKEKRIVFYNFYPSYVLPFVLLRLFGFKPTLDLEDISELSFSASRHGSCRECIEQSIGWFSMIVMLRAASAVIIPTSRFSQYIPKNKTCVLLSGCCRVPEDLRWPSLDNGKLNVILSGKLCEEHGLNLVYSMLNEEKYRDELLSKFVFYFCGRGDNQNEAIYGLKALNESGIVYLGYLDDKDYDSLLKKSHVGLVLQDPHGKNSERKTPSKGYEYLSNCKAIVITDVGDFTELPHESKVRLLDYTPSSLFETLMEVQVEDYMRIAEHGYGYAKSNYDLSVLSDRVKDIC